MITIVSPTTTMDFNKISNIDLYSNPTFEIEVNYLIELLKTLSIDDISNLMTLSKDLSQLNYDRYQNFNCVSTSKLQSIFAFDGEVFNCMKVNTFRHEDLEFANSHIRILSGLYGVLSPLDKIQPHRLEMKAKLENKYGKDLYKFWKDKITEYIISNLKKHENKILVNLASSEYIKAIDLKEIKKHAKFIDIVFKEYNPNNDTYKVKGLYAKKARGYMVNYIVKNKIDNFESLKLFNEEGYTFNPILSSDDIFIFTR